MLPPELITSRTNAKVKALRAAFHGKSSKPGELVGIEGAKAVLEAFNAGLRFDTLAVTAAGVEEHTPERTAHLNARDLIVLTEEVMASAVDTGSPARIAATVHIPEQTTRGVPSGIFLLLEDIQDPGNVGTLIRSAEAFGVEHLYLSPGCANPWSPKVIRSSAGSVFRQGITRQSISTAVAALRAGRVRVLGAVARSEGASLSHEINLASPVALVIGNEGAGLSSQMLQQLEGRVYIPCATESLNAAVAGSILLYDAFTQSSQRMARQDNVHPQRRSV